MEHNSSKIIRKYNTDFRKKLNNKIIKLKNKSDYIEIYNIIYNDIGNNYSTNRNGIFINLNTLSDCCIDDIINYINDKLTMSNTCETEAFS